MSSSEEIFANGCFELPGGTSAGLRHLCGCLSELCSCLCELQAVLVHVEPLGTSMGTTGNGLKLRPVTLTALWSVGKCFLYQESMI